MLLATKTPYTTYFEGAKFVHFITARAIQVHETAGAFAALAMGLNGIATAILVPLVLKVASG